MFAQLTRGMELHASALVVRAERQRTIASNIANADTPGYTARDVNFKDAMAAVRGDSRLAASQPVLGNPANGHGAHIAIGRPGDGSIGDTGSLAYTARHSRRWTTTASTSTGNAPTSSTTPCGMKPLCASSTAMPRRS